MKLPMRPDGIATRIVLAALVVVAIALAILAVGVLRIGSETFMKLMNAVGAPADEAATMFQSSVAEVLAIAALVAAVAALAVGMLLARRIARPIERLAEAAQRTAEGDLRASAVVEGPAEVRALARSFNVMVDRLAEQDAVRREFVVNAAHELRTPLTNLQGYLEALRDGVLPPDPATFDSLREEVDRLTRLASSLDALAGADDERPMPEDLDLGALVRTGLELAAPSLARRQLTIDATIPAGIVVHARRQRAPPGGRQSPCKSGPVHPGREGDLRVRGGRARESNAVSFASSKKGGRDSRSKNLAGGFGKRSFRGWRGRQYQRSGGPALLASYSGTPFPGKDRAPFGPPPSEWGRSHV